MKKIYSLLLLCLLGTVSAWAETETVTVKSWDFVKYSDENCTHDEQVNIAYSTTQENGMYPGTGYVDGLLFATNGTAWKYFYRTNNTNSGLYSVNGGGRNVAIKDVKAGDIVRITATAVALPTTATNGTYDTEKSSSTDAYYVVTADGYLTLNFTRYIYIRTITVTREVEAGTCENPTYNISGVDGTARKFTLACTTPSSTIYYSTTELEAGAEGWTEYTGEVTTSAGTIYAYASAGDANSEVISFATGAGSKLTLNAPYANKTAYADGSYTVSIGSDQSSLSIVPSTVNYYYSIDGGAEEQGTSAIVPAGKTLTVYAVADGYTNSANTVCETSVRPTGLVKVWNQDYTTVTQATGDGAYAVTIDETAAFTVGERSFYNITGYTANNENFTAELNSNVGINTASYFYLRCKDSNSGILKNANNGGTTGYIGIQNLTPGQYIIITTNGNTLSATEGCTDNLGMNTTSEYIFQATATEASIFFQHGTYNYVKTITVYNPSTEDITINSTTKLASYVTTFALDFSEEENLKAYIATTKDSKSVKLSEVTYVPAGTPVIIRSLEELTENKTYSLPLCESTTDDVSGNILRGHTTESYEVKDGDGIYALSKIDGMMHPVEVGVPIPAKKAYLKTGDSAGAKEGLKLVYENEEEATAINNAAAEAEAVSTKLYNAAGQQVGKGYRGMVIDSNGKKSIR